MLVWCGDEATHEEHPWPGARDTCPGRPASGAVPSDEQWLAYLRGHTDERALELVREVRLVMERGHQCFLRNHEAHIEAQRETIARQQVRIDELAEKAS